MSTTLPDDRVTSYQPLVATTTFEADFPVFDDTDLSVFHDGVKREDFTVSATYVEGVSNDAKVIFATGLIGDVLVVGSRSPRRNTRFTNGGPIPVWQQNLALDTLAGQAQEACRDSRRAVKAPFDSDGYGIEGGIPSGSVLVMNGDRIEGGPSYSGIQDAVEDAQNAAAAAALSEQNAAASAVQSGAFANAAGASAQDAQEAELEAQALVEQATAGFIGFVDGLGYDFGSVTDPLTFFDQDWGTL